MALSLLLASGLYVVGVFFCLILTLQPERGGWNAAHEGFFNVFLIFLMAFVVVSLFAAGIGLSPLLSVDNGRAIQLKISPPLQPVAADVEEVHIFRHGLRRLAWWRGVLGFMAGSVISALGLAFLVLASRGAPRHTAAQAWVAWILVLGPPPVGGLLALKALLARAIR